MPRSRAQPPTPSTGGSPRSLERALSDLTADDLRRPPADAALLLRLTAEEKTQMEAAAQSVGLTVSAYLRELHRIAWAKLR